MTDLNQPYQFTLSDEDLAVAVGELNEPEDNDERLRRINNLRTAFIKQNKKLRLFRTDDNFMLRFLRAKKFHHHRALEMMVNYHTKLPAWPEVFEKFLNPALIRNVFEAGDYVVARGKAKDGSALCIGRSRLLETYLATDYVAATLVTHDRLLQDERVQIYGITMIEDLSLLGFRVLKQLINIPFARRFVALHQNVIPVRLRNVCLVNASPITSLVFNLLLRPMFNDKLKKRIRIYGNYADLNEVIDDFVLPPCYGGTGDVINVC